METLTSINALITIVIIVGMMIAAITRLQP